MEKPRKIPKAGVAIGALWILLLLAATFFLPNLADRFGLTYVYLGLSASHFLGVVLFPLTLFIAVVIALPFKAAVSAARKIMSRSSPSR